MRAYIIRRILILIPTLLILTFVSFSLMHLAPGNIVDAMVASMPSEEMIGMDPAVYRAEIMRKLGLDAPLIVQYGRFIGVAPQVDGGFSGLLQGDLGVSWWRGVPVAKLVSVLWPTTLQLGIMALVIAQLVALPIGIFSALRQDTWGDYVGRSFALVWIAVPGFWIATLVIVYPSIWWGYMPPIMLVRFIDDPLRNLEMFILPATILGMGMAGFTMRMTRTMMLEVLRQDYVRTAWAKGLRERIVVIRHALKNAFIPIITIIGLQVPILIGGAVIIERIFALPGIGRLMLSATLNRDYPLVAGTLVLFSVALVFINLAVDLTYAYLDPRVRYK